MEKSAIIQLLLERAIKLLPLSVDDYLALIQFFQVKKNQQE